MQPVANIECEPAKLASSIALIVLQMRAIDQGKSRLAFKMRESVYDTQSFHAFQSLIVLLTCESESKMQRQASNFLISIRIAQQTYALLEHARRLFLKALA